MNKLARTILIVGGLIILLLLIVLPSVSKLLTRSVQVHLNEGLQQIKENIARNNPFGVAAFDYIPFDCYGIASYECKSEAISIRALNNKGWVEEIVLLENLSLGSKNASDKNIIRFNASTSLSYPSEMNPFLSSNIDRDTLDLLNQVSMVLLPSELDCNQSYSRDGQDPRIISMQSHCKFDARLANLTIDLGSTLRPNVDKTHILGILYDIVMAASGNDDRPELSLQKIPHKLDSLILTLESKTTFGALIKNKKGLEIDLDSEQEEALERRFHFSLKLLQAAGDIFFSKYFGKKGKELSRGIVGVAKGSIKSITVEFKPKNPRKFYYLEDFYNEAVVDWLAYLASNYDLLITKEEL